MTLFGLTLSILGLVLLILSLATIILYAGCNRSNDRSDEHADHLGIGGGEILIHVERN